MSIWEKFGFKSRGQKEREKGLERLQGEITEKQKELVVAIFKLDNFNRNLAEGGRMVPGDTGRQALMEDNISRIRKELEGLKTRLPKQ